MRLYAILCLLRLARQLIELMHSALTLQQPQWRKGSLHLAGSCPSSRAFCANPHFTASPPIRLWREAARLCRQTGMGEKGDPLVVCIYLEGY